MSQDIVADALNQIMNAKKVGKNEVEIKRVSKLLLNLFEMMKDGGYIDFEQKDERTIMVKLIKINECRAIKPRYYVTVKEIDKYLRRFLPSRNFGTLVVSTSKGLIGHNQAYENKIGGSLIAFFY